MLNKLNYSYNEENSIIHRINSIVKILGLIIYIIVCLLKYNNMLFICSISLVFLLLLLSNISIIKYIKVIWKLKYILILLYVILLRSNIDILDINVLMFKLVFLILYIVMVFYTTTKEDIGIGITSIIDMINIFGFNMKRVTLFVTNIMVYLDYLIDSYNELVIDMELKGKEYISKSIIGRIHIMINNYKKVLNSLIEKIKYRKKDMNYRLYNNKIRSKYKYRTRLAYYDYIYILLFISLIICYCLRVK